MTRPCVSPRWIIAATTAACTASLTLGQESQEDPIQPVALQPLDWRVVDQGFEDVGPVAASLRQERADLRVPSGFERVYEVPGVDGLLMRADGGLRAVFPRSTYRVTERGVRPIVPPGTVWTFGDPTPAFGANENLSERAVGSVGRLAATESGPALAVSVSAAMREGVAPLATPVALPRASALPTDAPGGSDGAPPRRLDMSDSFYRVARLRSIAKKYGPR
jgi:hypothetical protein